MPKGALPTLEPVSAPKSMTPRAVYDLVYNRLATSPDFRDIIKPKPRCIRVNFPGKFHLDVVPALLDGCAASATRIVIPNVPAAVGNWKTSDPKGFAAWFEEMCKKVKPRMVKAAYARNMSEGHVDPVPDPEPYHLKKPLKRAVQLLKRWRDVQFHGREELATPSIVVTRLAAQFYDGEPDPYEAVQFIVDAMHALFAHRCPEIRNPVNDEEVISEKWHEKPECFEAFKVAIADLRDRWRRLPELEGVKAVVRELEDLFGDPAADAVRDVFAPIEAARARGSLHVSRDTRTLVPAAAAVAVPASSIKVRGSTFHGD